MTARPAKKRPVVHVFRAREQPAHCFKAHGHTFRYPGRGLRRCHKCRKLRWNLNLAVQAYYDCWVFLCASGKGCRA
jgi:hypothetical protein